MTLYILKRLGSAALVVAIVTVLTFLGTRLLFPDPVQNLLGGQDSAATPEQIEQLRTDLGLNQPLWTQFWNWLVDLVHGDLGRSFLRQENVSDAVTSRLTVTGELVLFAIVIALIIGTILGVISALNRGKVLDAIGSVFSIVSLSLPNFFVGILLVFVFSLQLGLLPSSGYTPFFENPGQNLTQMVLPAVTLSLFYIGVFSRYVRTLMIGTLGEDYSLRAHASGLPPVRVWTRYGLKNTMIPMITVVGLNVAGLVGGAVVTEQIYSVPGVGRLLTDAILGRDFPVVQGVILVVAVLVVIINLVVDLLYGLLDPRIKGQGK
jgi:peptide/nickel transport system permease protein